jgi:pimeloyl-ACP methyl ester carboxylesterase
MSGGGRVTFGLVHGGAHGAWCWERLVPRLEARGHLAVAPDLPCDDDAAGTAEYADVVADALSASNGNVVLVAHSLGGLTAPLVAERRHVVRMVFVAGLLPVTGKSFRDQQAEEPDILFPYHGGRPGLRDRFFGNCSPEDADWAMARIRDQALKPFTEPTPLRAWPDVPSSYVLCTDDRACNPAWSRRAARGRLGVEPIELVGADHSPFLSRPAALADLLVGLATEPR